MFIRCFTLNSISLSANTCLRARLGFSVRLPYNMPDISISVNAAEFQQCSSVFDNPDRKILHEPHAIAAMALANMFKGKINHLDIVKTTAELMQKCQRVYYDST